MAIAILTGKTNVCVSSQLLDDDPTNDKVLYQPTHKCPKPNHVPRVSYNSTSTVLNMSFPGNSQGGRVEIFRNGIKVVNATVPAGASLNYVLRNYGKGEFTVIVSQGNTVVYSNSVIVK